MTKPNRKHPQKFPEGRRVSFSPRLCLMLVGVAVLGVWLFQASGLSGYYQMQEEQAQLHQEIRELEQDNTRLQEKIRRVQHDPATLEALAREQLGMVRDGEVVYQLVKQK